MIDSTEMETSSFTIYATTQDISLLLIYFTLETKDTQTSVTFIYECIKVRCKYKYTHVENMAIHT